MIPDIATILMFRAKPNFLYYLAREIVTEAIFSIFHFLSRKDFFLDLFNSFPDISTL